MNHHLETLALDPDDPYLAYLTPRSRSILLRRKTMTLQQIADQEGVSATRIRQIEVAALWKLRNRKRATATRLLCAD
jgi:DNA-directed RNA polymerase sigma subunit (sigma70/sigma32)